MTKPTEPVPTWGTDKSNDAAPTTGQRASGWTTNQVPPSRIANNLQRLNGEWLSYLAGLVLLDNVEAIGFRTTVFSDWTDSHAYVIGDIVHVPYRGFLADDTGAGNVYVCTTAGASGDGTGGVQGPPAGTGAGIVDGAAAWTYLGHDGYRHGEVELVGHGPLAFNFADSGLASGKISCDAGAGQLDWVGGSGAAGCPLRLQPGDMLTRVRWGFDRNATNMTFGLYRRMNIAGATVDTVAAATVSTGAAGDDALLQVFNHTIVASYNYWVGVDGASGQKLNGCTPYFKRPTP